MTTPRETHCPRAAPVLTHLCYDGQTAGAGGSTHINSVALGTHLRVDLSCVYLIIFLTPVSVHLGGCDKGPQTGKLTSNRNSVLTVPEVQGHGHRAGMVGLRGELSSELQTLSSHCVFTCWKRAGGLGVSFKGTLTTFLRTPPS